MTAWSLWATRKKFLSIAPSPLTVDHYAVVNFI